MTRFKTFHEVEKKSHPSKDIHHEFVFWVFRPLTWDEYVKLDNALVDTFSDLLGEDHMGYSGPIPFPEEKSGD